MTNLNSLESASKDGRAGGAPLFSILVPTYNQCSYLGPALDSLLAQTESSWEAVVVNDGSTDDTAAVLADYQRRDRRIRVIHQKNGGVASALNTALANASGQWICWLSSDDLFDPCKLEINRDWIKRNPQTKFFFSYFRLLRESTGELTNHGLWGPVPPCGLQIITLFYRNYISGITICVERRAWSKIGAFDPALRYAQDYDMWLRILAQHQGRLIPEWTVTNRNHAAQGSEVFPQACYYDTARAAIHHINRHGFAELCAGADLSNPSVALSCVARALDIAGDPTAFVYALGPHRGLVLRILEWVYAAGAIPEPWRDRLVRLVRDRCGAFARSSTGGFKAMWDAIDDECLKADPQFRYQEIDPASVAEAWLPSLGSEGVPLADYLGRFLGHRPKPPMPVRPQLVIASPAPSPTGSDRQQVLFLARALWGGGAERVTFDLVHALDPPRHDLRVAYLFDSTRSVAFAPYIRVTRVGAAAIALPPAPLIEAASVQNPAPAALHQQTSNGLTRARATARDLAAIYRRLPRGLRQALQIGAIVRSARAWLRRTESRPPVIPSVTVSLSESNSVAVISPPSIQESDRNHPLFGDAIDQALGQAVQLGSDIATLNADALIIAVMEEASCRIWLAQAVTRRNYICWLHSMESYNLSLMYSDPARLAAERWMLAGACMGAQRVVAPSEGCRDDLVLSFGIPHAHIDVIPNPVDCLKVMRRATEPPDIDLEPFVRGRSLFVAVGRLSPDKNFRLLIDACAALRRRREDFCVAIIGRGPLHNELLAQIKVANLSDHVIICDETENPYPYMARASGLVLTSKAESFSLVLVEAMLCGTWPIAVDCPSGPREILVDGQFGALVAQDDPAALANALADLIDRPLSAGTAATLLQRAFAYDVPEIAAKWEATISETKMHSGSTIVAAADNGPLSALGE